MTSRAIARRFLAGAVCLCWAAAHAPAADDAYFMVALSDLKLTDGALPDWTTEQPYRWRTWQTYQNFRPYVRLNGPGEAYVRAEGLTPFNRSADVYTQSQLFVRAPRGKDAKGSLYLPKRDFTGLVQVRFSLAAASAKPERRNDFYAAKQAYYQELLNRGAAGGAWFRHQQRLAQRASGGNINSNDVARIQSFNRINSLEDTYALFAGGRAISENLQLDRVLLAPNSTDETVELSKIRGITIAEIQWDERIKDKHPQLDPLASRIPADQHAIFFPSFKALTTLIDQLNAEGTVVLSVAEPDSQDAGTLPRYEKQLGVSLSAAARAIGPSLVKTVAITGGDPYYRTGTDIAILFETDQPQVLRELLASQIKSAAAERRGKVENGEIAGAKFASARNDDRAISSFLAAAGSAVILSNSQQQLERLLKTAAGDGESLAKLPEYAFFRDRYPLGAEDETALIFLSDATIRRWCSPKWRIATSRQTRDLAVLAELQATHLDRLVGGKVQTGPLYTDLPMSSAGEVTLTPKGVVSDVSGTIAFQTPIAEMGLERVGRGEAEAYERWRDGYQRNWRWAFDPIALKLTVGDGRLAGDLSVMPLIGGTEYREFIGLTQGAAMAPNAGDPHDALLHYVLAINRKSPTIQQYSNLASMMSRDVRIDPLSWIGDTVALYFDPDPFWQDLAGTDPDQYFEFISKHDFRFPVALRVEVSSGLKLAAFLAGVRAFIDQTGPGLTVWDSQTHRDQPYTRIRASERATAQSGIDRLAIYYSVVGDGLVITPNEDLLKRAIDRQLDADAKAKSPDGDADKTSQEAWLGKNVSVKATRGAVDALAAFSGQQYQAQMQALSWSNLPILNEWKRAFPDQDPVELHEKFWHTRLVCPGGGKYVWNEAYQTMESTVYGNPGEPKTGPAAPPMLQTIDGIQFGLTFEDQGLRARVNIDRRKPAAEK